MCPLDVKVQDAIIPSKREKKIMTDDTKLIKSISDGITELFFKWKVPQDVFKNIYNNIDNYNEFYKDSIEIKKTELLAKISEIISNKELNLDSYLYLRSNFLEI